MDSHAIHETLPRPIPAEVPKPPRWMEHAQRGESTPRQIYERLSRDHAAVVGRIERLVASKDELVQKRASLFTSDGDAAKLAKELANTDAEIEIQEHRLKTAVAERDAVWLALRAPAQAVLIDLADQLLKLSDTEQAKRSEQVLALLKAWDLDATTVEGKAYELAAHHPLVVRTWRDSEDAKSVYQGTSATEQVIQRINSCSATVAELAPLITPDAAPAG